MFSAIFFALIFACADEEGKGKSKSFQHVDAGKVKQITTDVELVPSPLKLQEELKAKGLQGDLSPYVFSKNLDLTMQDKDLVAIRAGVLVSDLVLTIKKAPVEKSIASLRSLKTGFQTLGTGNDIQATIDGLISSLESDSPDLNEILQEMDLLSQAMVAELQYEAGDWVVPLIQAGTWLEGAYLISTAIKAEGNMSAEEMLRQPGTVKYFHRYVTRSGSDKAPSAVITKLADNLLQLETVAQKKKLEAADVEKINALVKDILTML